MVGDPAPDSIIRPTTLSLRRCTIITFDTSPALGLCAVSRPRSWRSWSAPMIFMHKGQEMLLCQAAHLVGANVFLGRCSASAFWMVSHQLPKQLPKLHLMPIKPVSLPLPPDCVCNIKKLSDPFRILADISAKVLGTFCRWTLSPRRRVSV